MVVCVCVCLCVCNARANLRALHIYTDCSVFAFIFHSMIGSERAKPKTEIDLAAQQQTSQPVNKQVSGQSENKIQNEKEKGAQNNSSELGRLLL